MRKKSLQDEFLFEEISLESGGTQPNRLSSMGNTVILPPMDVKESFSWLRSSDLRVTTTILDPWYNKGVGGTREDYREYIVDLLAEASLVSQHIYLWGFPEIVACFVERLPPPLVLVTWLTWFYKNNPSVIKGWRSSQMACLHIAQPGARLYPEHFLNEVQRRKLAEGKLRYMPGPTSVIEESLLVGFVGRSEQTGHPAQKPVGVYQKLIMMTTKEGDIVFDPMCGSGTTGKAVGLLNRVSILSDISEEYIQITEKRLHLERSTDISKIRPRLGADQVDICASST